MITQRKKDYFQRLIEEFFAKLHTLQEQETDSAKTGECLQDCFEFFSKNFDVNQSDTSQEIVNKIEDVELLEQYAKLLLTKYTITDIKEIEQLYNALAIIEYLQKTDLSYSWARTVMREDLLQLLDED